MLVFHGLANQNQVILWGKGEVKDAWHLQLECFEGGKEDSTSN